MTDTTKPVEEMKSADEESGGEYSEDEGHKEAPAEKQPSNNAKQPQQPLKVIGEEDELMHAQAKRNEPENRGEEETYYQQQMAQQQ